MNFAFLYITFQYYFLDRGMESVRPEIYCLYVVIFIHQFRGLQY